MNRVLHRAVRDIGALRDFAVTRVEQRRLREQSERDAQGRLGPRLRARRIGMRRARTPRHDHDDFAFHEARVAGEIERIDADFTASADHVRRQILA